MNSVHRLATAFGAIYASSALQTGLLNQFNSSPTVVRNRSEIRPERFLTWWMAVGLGKHSGLRNL